MSPQPVDKIKGAQSFVISEKAIGDRPDLAVLILKIISIGSNVDAMLFEIVCGLMKADLKIGAAIFEAVLGRNSREKMLRAATKAALKSDTEAQDLLDRVLKKVAQRRKTRDKFVHWLWAVPKDSEGIICVNPAYIVRISARHMEFKRSLTVQSEEQGSDNPNIPAYDDEDEILYPFLHYSKEDLEREVRDAEFVIDIVQWLQCSLDRGRSEDERRSARNLLTLTLITHG